MEFTVSSKQFAEQISRVQRAVDKRTTVALLLNILIRAHDDYIELAATNLRILIHLELEAKVQLKGEIAVSAENLMKIVRELPEGDLHFSLESNNWVRIVCGQSRYKLVGVPTEGFPLLPLPEAESMLQIPAKTFIEMVRKTHFAVSREMNRIIFTGINFICLDGTFTMVSTDGHRLVLLKREVNRDIPDFNLVVHHEGMRETIALIPRSIEDIEMSYTSHNIFFKFGTSYVVSTLIEGKYPNMEEALPPPGENVLSFNCEVMLQAIKQIHVFIDEEYHGIRAEISHDRMKLMSISPEYGEASVELEVSYEGEPITLGFSSRYLVDILNQIEGDDVALKFNDKDSSIRVEDPADKDYISLMMPIKYPV